MLKFIIIVISFALVLILITNVNGFDFNHYMTSIKALSVNPNFVSEYEKHVNKLIEIEPNYFNYTPFVSNEYNFDCFDNSTVYEEATSVHRLRPKDIKVNDTKKSDF